LFGWASDLAAWGPLLRLLVTITRADELRREIEIFATGDFAIFSTQSTLIGHPQTEEIRDPLGHP
jgi:hypothetical protein